MTTRLGCCHHNHPLVGAGTCRSCQRQLDADCAEFQRDVFFGVYNRLGYTEREWMACGYAREAWRQCERESKAVAA